MSRTSLPDRVRRLVLESIDSVAELEALLLLRETAPQTWIPEDVGSRLYVSRAVAAYSLTALANRGLLVERVAGFTYDPRTPELEDDVTALAQAYSTNLITVTHLIHAKPGPSVQDFARAFRWRKEP